MDWDKINTLLSVVHQAAAMGPKYSFIVAAAEEEITAEFQAVDEPAEDETVPSTPARRV
jgi:hypothetical protein